LKKRTSIYISKKIGSVIRAGDDSLSKRIGSVCERYDAILKKESPLDMFEQKEIKVLVKAFASVDLEPAGAIYGFPFIIADIIEFAEPGIHGVLIEKLKYLTTAQTVSLIEHIEKIIKKV
jgi:predicted metallopeptidase